MSFRPICRSPDCRAKTADHKRGFFFEAYHFARYAEHGINRHFVQDNMSRSRKGVLRGLHLQCGLAQASWSASRVAGYLMLR